MTGNFLDLKPSLSDPGTAGVVLLPVPYEATVSYASGTARGPEAILSASAQVELFDDELGRECVECGIATLPAVLPARTPVEQMQRIADAAGPYVEDGRFVLALGGEHSITAPLAELQLARHRDLTVLQIDAHADLRASYGGTPHSHAAVMRRVLEAGARLCQVGIRSYSRAEAEECPEQVAAFITPRTIREDPAWIDLVLARLGEAVYVTIDIDGLDPSIAPGTGTPEPDGLTWAQVTALLRRVAAARRIVSADVVEVRPIPPNHITEYLAARLAYKLIAYTQT